MKNNTFEEIAKVIEKGEVFLIFPHINMDGDALGSAGALCEALWQMNKQAYIVTEDDIAKNLKFLNRNYCKSYETVDLKNYISICVDCSEKSRFPKRENLFDGGDIKICIDHHKTADGFCDYNYIDPDAAATAELIYSLIEILPIKIDEKIAESIYAGINTDTGSFKYSNTTKKTHEIVAKLYDIKDDFSHVCVDLYENDSFERLALQSDILGNAKLFADGRGIVAEVTQDMLTKNNAVMDDSDGVVARLRAIGGVEVSVLLKENTDGTVKVSMRSKMKADVSSICQKYGGGGHTKAAGFTAEGKVDDIMEMVIKEVCESLE